MTNGRHTATQMRGVVGVFLGAQGGVFPYFSEK